jgi:hypothetical protein
LKDIIHLFGELLSNLLVGAIAVKQIEHPR